MARKFGSLEAVIDGRALSFKGSFEVDPVTTDIEPEVCLDGSLILQEMHKVASVKGTIQVPEETGIKTHLASIRDQTLRIVVGHLQYTYPRCALKVTGGMSEKGELGIELYPLAPPIEEVVS